MTPVRTLEPWAAIGVYWARQHTATAQEAGWLQMLADSTAIAMENVRAMDALRGEGGRDAVRMCAWTRRIDLDGQWVTIEEYLQRRFGLTVTHTISNDALETISKDLQGS